MDAALPSLPPDLTVAIKRWSSKRGNLIMVLHALQDHHGYVPWQLAKEVARALNVPLARIYEVLTFYSYFRIEPPGEFVTSVCRGTACHLKGGSKLFDVLSEHLGIDDGQTTEDRRFHLQSVRCLGCCGLAPVVMINGRIYGKCTQRQALDLIAERQAHAVPSPPTH